MTYKAPDFRPKPELFPKPFILNHLRHKTPLKNIFKKARGSDSRCPTPLARIAACENENQFDFDRRRSTPANPKIEVDAARPVVPRPATDYQHGYLLSTIDYSINRPWHIMAASSLCALRCRSSAGSVANHNHQPAPSSHQTTNRQKMPENRVEPAATGQKIIR